jgi:hypothetical protein
MKFKVGDKVHDKWWAWKSGIIRKVFKNSVHIEFIFGIGYTSPYTVIYDKAHSKFLVKE